jgi:hypothetical protein
LYEFQAHYRPFSEQFLELSEMPLFWKISGLLRREARKSLVRAVTENNAADYFYRCVKFSRGALEFNQRLRQGGVNEP